MSTVEDFKKKLESIRGEEAMVTTEVGRIPTSQYIQNCEHISSDNSGDILYFVNVLENSCPLTEVSA